MSSILIEFEKINKTGNTDKDKYAMAMIATGSYIHILEVWFGDPKYSRNHFIEAQKYEEWFSKRMKTLMVVPVKMADIDFANMTQKAGPLPIPAPEKEDKKIEYELPPEPKREKKWVKITDDIPCTISNYDSHTMAIWQYTNTNYKQRCLMTSVLQDNGKWEFMINDTYDLVRSIVDDSKTYETKEECVADMLKEIGKLDGPDHLPVMVGLEVNSVNASIQWACKQCGIEPPMPGGMTF
jgi:hypothetical protein